ncbi:YeeE/YedE family protein [Polynucleobacter paneuropaeus]|nr:YeeE/YedE family protein [Polynucleobacter paneuropaeus]MBT8524069.1 YeeE/YedE family protein [Polynucleobacter paneuropaeus]MBT8542649.1 YeeE/YedE family protein [Polynucleobacter paneuropaeus]QWD16970.1 YeeE/YedE family protein [Polynucleobacter paneuropaeus]QWD46769.1 YeeE/YedE family protein [Polynucleobacter paneuropaeus]
MHIDWLAFTPGPSLLGGVLLGIATSAYVLLHGRILGISGIVGGLLRPVKQAWIWRIVLLLGILTSPLWSILLFDMYPVQIIEANWPIVIVAGLLVGFGAQYGSGCTSGHGICGLSRLSPRSLVAIVSFMISGFAVAYILRHLL